MAHLFQSLKPLLHLPLHLLPNDAQEKHGKQASSEALHVLVIFELLLKHIQLLPGGQMHPNGLSFSVEEFQGSVEACCDFDISWSRFS